MHAAQLHVGDAREAAHLEQLRGSRHRGHRLAGHVEDPAVGPGQPLADLAHLGDRTARGQHGPDQCLVGGVEQRWPEPRPRGVRRTQQRVAVDHPVVAGGVLVEREHACGLGRGPLGVDVTDDVEPDQVGRRLGDRDPGLHGVPVEDEGEAHRVAVPPSAARPTASRSRSRWTGSRSKRPRTGHSTAAATGGVAPDALVVDVVRRYGGLKADRIWPLPPSALSRGGRGARTGRRWGRPSRRGRRAAGRRSRP